MVSRSKGMVQVRIPGLDHSLSEDGVWLPDENYHRLTHERENAKRAAAKAEHERNRLKDGGVVYVGEIVAPR